MCLQEIENPEDLPVGQLRGPDRHRRRGPGQDPDRLGGPHEPGEGIQVSSRGLHMTSLTAYTGNFQMNF